MKKLKLFFACLLMAVLSIGQVWAADVTSTMDLEAQSPAYTANTTSYTGTESASWTLTKTCSTQSVGTESSVNDKYYQIGSGSKSATSMTWTSSSFSGQKIKQVVVKCSSSAAQASAATVTVTATGGTFTASTSSIYGSTVSTLTFNSSNAGGDEISGDLVVNLAFATSQNKNIRLFQIDVIYDGGGAPNPGIITPDPAEVSFSADEVNDGEISVSFTEVSDLDTQVDDVALYANEAHTAPFDGGWFTAAWNADKSKIEYHADANTGDARTVYIYIYALDDNSNELDAVIPVTQAKYSAPTGTFELFSGDIEEGDYVIYYGGGAMNTTVTSNRLQYLSVTPAEDKIVNPDETIIWHIAASGDYWTLYNAAEEKYAASTSAKNQATMAAGDLTNNMKWSITGSATYEFENLARSTGTDSGNKWLRKNGTYGFACYSSTQSGTGPLTLYKKQVAGQPKAPTFSVPGGNYETAQSVELSCETVGAKIYYTLDGSKPSSTSTEYSTAIPVSATTTIKAIAIKDNVESTVATATYTIVVWQTVADVWDDITEAGPLNAHIYGYVSQTNVGGFDNNFYISDNGSTEGNQLYAYRMNMNSFSVAVGDKVKLAGDLTDYQGTKEFKYANQGATQGLVVALEAKGDLQSVAVSGTPTKTEYAANETFDPAGLKVYGTYANGFVGEITEGITWGNDLTEGKVTENTTVHVTATVSEIASPAYDVAVTVAAKTLVSITVGTASYTIYTGEVLPEPTITATYSEGPTADVSAEASYDTENAFDTETLGDQTITVSYTFGAETKTTTYTVTVIDYENADDAPYPVAEALHIITDAIHNVESAREIVVAGTVSAEKISGYKNRYKISDGTNELLVYNGKGFESNAFTDADCPKVGDVVVVKGNVIHFNNSTPEFVSGKSYLLSQVRPATLATEAVTNFEVGSADIEVADLTFTTASDGVITFASSNHEEYVKIVDGKLRAVAPGTATITANLAATEKTGELNYAAASTTFSVTVIATQVKYTITFDGNGADGGSAPAAIAAQPEGAEVALPGNTYTKTNKIFDGWKVINNTTTEEVTVTAGKFTMPASAVTIQAQWANPSVWALTYTSNVALTANSSTKSYAEKVKITVEEVLTEFNALRACTGSAAGSCTVKVPAGTQTLHFHAAAWADKTSTITVTMGETELLVQSLTADAGITSNSPYTLAGNAYEYYYSIDLSSYSLAEETTITFSAGSDKRFVLFGVNQEGGSVPVLDHLAITGTMTNTTGWKTGDNIEPEGLTVTAYYTLNDAAHHNTDVTADVTWSHAPLTEGQTEVTLTATYTDGVEKSASTNVTIDAVETGSPTIITTPATQATFTTTERGAALPAAKTIAVTLKNITSATATLDGTNPGVFSLSKTTDIVDGDEISVSVVSTDIEVASYSATVTIKDASGDTQKSINIYLTIKEPEAVETPVGTDTKWIPATSIVDGMKVLITGANDDDTFAMGAQSGNNRSAVKGSFDAENHFVPGEGTMAFTLVKQADDSYALQTSDSKYLYAGASGNNRLLTREAIGEDNNANWTVAVNALSANGDNRGVMQFNNGSTKLFNCYGSASQSPVALYVLYVAPTTYAVNIATGIENGTIAADPTSAEAGGTITLTITPADGYELSTLSVIGDVSGDEVTVISNQFTMPAEAVTVNATFSLIPTPPTPVYETVRTGLEVNRYYTVCLPKKVTAIKGASFWTLNNKSQDGATAYLEEETNNLPFAAGKPFIIQATAENLEVVYEGDATEVAGINGALHGTLVYMNAAALAAAGSDVYMLFNNVLCPVGENNHLDANRAYVLLSELNAVAEAPQGAPGKRVVAMPMQKDEAQGFDNLESGDAPKKVMIDGTLYILRGEKVFDATGRLVK